MSRHLVIVGSGIAGLAAAHAAKKHDARVTVVHAGAGASALGGGAVDARRWESVARDVSRHGEAVLDCALPANVLDFAKALDLWSLPADRYAWIATVAGRARPARGCDRGVLDLGGLPPGVVVLPRAPRAMWDADALAVALSDEPWARKHGLFFTAIDAPVLRFEDEARIADADLAARHDDPARLAWLAERLRSALGSASAQGAVAVLLGPWLGIAQARAADLSKRIGLPVGEAVAGVGSSAGLRFEARRDAFLKQLGAKVIAERCVRADTGSVTLASGTSVAADAVLLALGGVAAGGVVYAPPTSYALDGLGKPGGTVPFRLSVEANADLAVIRGVPDAFALDVTSSLFGPELDTTAWPAADALGALEAAGIRTTGGVLVRKGLYAAGDVVAGPPRTLLAAVASGLAAGDFAGR